MHIDVEIDIADARLRGAMRTAFMPAAGAGPRVPDVGEPQAAPLRQRTRALAAELPRQHDLLAVPVRADDVRAELTMPALVAAGYLLLAEDGVAEKGVGGRGHWRASLPANCSCYVLSVVPW